MAKTPALFRDHGLRTVLYYGVITLLSGGPVTKRLQALIFCLGGSFWRDSFHYNGSQS